MERGEVWSVSIPFTTDGREQAGQRPAVVIQDASYGHGSPLVIVVPVTSQLSASRFPATIRIDPNPGNGLRLPSIAMVFQVRALDRSRFVQRLGVIAAADVRAILGQLRKLTGE